MRRIFGNWVHLELTKDEQFYKIIIFTPVTIYCLAYMPQFVLFSFEINKDENRL